MQLKVDSNTDVTNCLRGIMSQVERKYFYTTSDGIQAIQRAGDEIYRPSVGNFLYHTVEKFRDYLRLAFAADSTLSFACTA